MMADYQDSPELKLVLTSPVIYHLFKGTPLLTTCMRLEAVIIDKKKPYIEKLELFIFVLEGILSISVTAYDFPAEGISQVFQFIQRNALNLLLDGDWGANEAARSHVTFMLSRLKETFFTTVLVPLVRDGMEYLITLSSNPWGNPVLTKILHDEPCSDEEVLLLFQYEIGIVLMTRLEKMLEARCETQAIKLIRVFFQCVRHPKYASCFNLYMDDILCVQEMYLTLLVKKKENHLFVDELRKMGLREGYTLVQQCLKSERSLWLRKYQKQMVELVLNSVLMKAMFQPIIDETLLCSVINEWFNLCHKAHTFQVFNQMCLNAVTSLHIYLLCKVLVERYGGFEKKRCIELYIRALTVNLNELENLKLNDQQENIRKSEVQMSKGFLSLADFLREDIITSREIVLTAFSLNPTKDCYNRLEGLARASVKLESSNGQFDNFQSNQFPSLAHANISTNLHAKELSSISGPKFVVDITEAQIIGVSQRLCDDLLTVISRARYKELHWKLDWSELSSRCERYLTSGKDTLDTEKELLYLKIDYHQFIDWPQNAKYYTGFEKCCLAKLHRK